MRLAAAVLSLVGFVLPCAGPPYKDPRLPVEERVRDLLARMTPREKFRQLFMVPGSLDSGAERLKDGIFGLQVEAAESAAETARKINEIQRFFRDQTRLGIPVIPFEEALHGLVHPGATAFPQAIGLAAAFDPELTGRVAAAVARETRTRGIRQVLSPVVNIADDVRWGRVEETYGEDPFLASEMSRAFVAAFEGEGVITTPKHLLANSGAGGRDSYPIHWNERLLRELYLPSFEACLRRGGSRSVMTAYNSLDGRPASAQDWLLNRLLKTEWGFQGFVVSDAAAVGGATVLHGTARDYPDAAAQALAAGLDVIFQTRFDQEDLFNPPFLDGTIDQAVIDEAVARVLRAKFEAGLFDDPFVDPEAAGEWNGHPSHRALALEAARKSIVLLKNEGRALPLRPDLGSLAVLGPDAAEARLGGYSRPGDGAISVLEGIRAKIGKTAEIRHARGCGRESIESAAVPPAALSCEVDGRTEEGLRGEYFDNIALRGTPVLVRADPQIKFQWTLGSPDPEKLEPGDFSVRWSGRLIAPESGRFRIGVDGDDGYRLFFDGRLLIDNWVKRTRRTLTAEVELESGQAYDIRLEYFESERGTVFNLVWNAGIPGGGDREMEEAVRTAASAEAAVIVAGIEEGEFRDRARLGLPGRQEELIRRVAAAGRPTIVVLIGGSAITMSGWLDDVPGVVAAWYPGEAGGAAVADVLFGEANPAGRLPVTFPVFEGQLPLAYNHKPTGRGDDYLDLSGRPLFPFGFGLSYTEFAYDGLDIDRNAISPGGTAAVSCRVTNTGSRAGEEVVQLYVRDVRATVARPIKELKGFQRIFLGPGETKNVRFNVGPETLAMLDAGLKKTVEPGDFQMMIGSSSADIRLRGTLTVK